jgi:hypothetical protein
MVIPSQGGADHSKQSGNMRTWGDRRRDPIRLGAAVWCQSMGITLPEGSEAQQTRTDSICSSTLPLPAFSATLDLRFDREHEYS